MWPRPPPPSPLCSFTDNLLEALPPEMGNLQRLVKLQVRVKAGGGMP
jgi:hypothetical protein